MKYTQSGNTYLLVLNKGEEIVSALTQFATETNLTCATVSGIGATDDAELGVFDTFEKQYYTKQIRAMTEITALCGNVTQKDGKPYVHLHATLATMFDVVGGHLTKAVVSATCEIFVQAFPIATNRQFDSVVGINLLTWEDNQ
jgi:predicted DNA-binding protein with PD1-like motif